MLLRGAAVLYRADCYMEKQGIYKRAAIITNGACPRNPKVKR
jgi:hypothetical protein